MLWTKFVVSWNMMTQSWSAASWAKLRGNKWIVFWLWPGCHSRLCLLTLEIGFVVKLFHETLVPDVISQLVLEAVEERREMDGALVARSAPLTQLILSCLLSLGLDCATLDFSGKLVFRQVIYLTCNRLGSWLAQCLFFKIYIL